MNDNATADTDVEYDLIDVNYSVECGRFYVVRRAPDPYAGLWKFVSRADVERARAKERQQAAENAERQRREQTVQRFFACMAEHRIARENVVVSVNRSLRAGVVPGAVLMDVARRMPAMYARA